MQYNPLKEFIDDEQYQMLSKIGFLNERAVRDYYIRKKFWGLRDSEKPKAIFEELQQEFPYLTEESIRKIAYSKLG